MCRTQQKISAACLRWLAILVVVAHAITSASTSAADPADADYWETDVIRLNTGASAQGWIGQQRPKQRVQNNGGLPIAVARPGLAINATPALRPDLPPLNEPVDVVVPSAAKPDPTTRCVDNPPAATTSASAIHVVSQATTVDAVPTDDVDVTNAKTLSALELSRSLTGISLSAAVQSPSTTGGESLRLPEDHAQSLFTNAGVHFDQPNVPSQADALGWRTYTPTYHNPLYFEDPNMERCGRGFGCLTEVAAVARFFGRIPITPYMYGSNPPHECVRSAGECPACHRYRFHAYIPPLNLPGVAAQAAATVGLIFIIP